MSRGRKGFTLIELLVVIAIIGILAAMVFPVFARARESARKAVCLSNVKNIGLAIQMYLGDNNDVLPPDEHRAEVQAYFDLGIGRGRPKEDCNRPPQANPYLRMAVVLDEYVKNRDVWRCPSAKVVGGAGSIVPVTDYFTYWKEWEGTWGREGSANGDLGPCYPAWPSGWGGEVTDSCLQDRLATSWLGQGGSAVKAFQQSIGTMECQDVKLASVDDTANYVITGDMGVQCDDSSWAMLAYPDLCNLECSTACSSADWELCASTAADCGLYYNAPNNGAFLRNPELVKRFARHLGGTNVGFLDGHAQWMNSQTLIQRAGDAHLGKDTLAGSSFWGPTSYDPWTDSCYPTGGIYIY